MLRHTGERHLLDLCSGSGGPGVVLRDALDRAGVGVTLTLSDLVPNQRALTERCRLDGPGIDFLDRPIDATSVPADLLGFRTVVNAFHHLPPDAARRVLADAARAGRGIAVIEVTERRLLSLLFMITVIPVAVLLLTPFITPWRPGRLVWTYLVPVMPLMIAFDGFVSCLRTYSVPELRGLVSGVDVPGYGWRFQRIRVGPNVLNVTLLIGGPGLTDPETQLAGRG